MLYLWTLKRDEDLLKMKSLTGNEPARSGVGRILHKKIVFFSVQLPIEEMARIWYYKDNLRRTYSNFKVTDRRFSYKRHKDEDKSFKN